MSSISVTVPYRLDVQEAVARIHDAVSEAERTYRDRFQELSLQWEDNLLNYRFQTMGVTVQGTLAVESTEVVVQAELPASAWFLRGMIEKQIRERLSQLLS